MDQAVTYRQLLRLEGRQQLHLDKIGAKLTRLSKKQADYISVPEQGPYKPDHYRY